MLDPHKTFGEIYERLNLIEAKLEKMSARPMPRAESAVEAIGKRNRHVSSLGYDLFEVNREPGLEIQRDDEADVFAHDDQAAAALVRDIERGKREAIQLMERLIVEHSGISENEAIQLAQRRVEEMDLAELTEHVVCALSDEYRSNPERFREDQEMYG